MSHFSIKIFTFLVVTLSLSANLVAGSGLDYLPSLSSDFQTLPYLDFIPPVDFTVPPHLGMPYDSSLVGYWGMNEGLGLEVHDSSGNANNGTLVGGSWVDGKFGQAINFDGSMNYVQVNDSSSLRTNGDWTRSIWVYSNVPLVGDGALHEIWTQRTMSNKFLFRIDSNGGWAIYYSATDGFDTISIPKRYQQWSMITVVKTGFNLTVTENGNIVASVHNVADEMVDSSMLVLGANAARDSGWFTGRIDDVRIYKRALSTGEIAALYTIGPYAQPDPVSFANYYNYTDSITKNALLISIDNSNSNGNNVGVVTCTNFFVDNRLVFEANSSLIVNVWTNLGKPIFISGACIWNIQNYTTTLALNSSSVAELNWNAYNIITYVDANSGVSPSNVTVAYGENQTINFNATRGYRFNVGIDGESQGQISSFTFNNVTASHTINVTSTLLTYTISALADSHSTISPDGEILINYSRSQLFIMQANTGYSIAHVYVDSVDLGVVPSYAFSNVLGNHTISVTSLPIQTQQPITMPSTQIMLIAAIVVVVAIFVLAFKKGYITIEVVDEENSQEDQDD